MKRIFVAAVIACVAGPSFAGTVNGYVRKDGTYVAPYQRSAPDSQRWNNYGSQTMGGTERDEFSNPPAYNQPTPSYQPYNTAPAQSGLNPYHSSTGSGY